MQTDMVLEQGYILTKQLKAKTFVNYPDMLCRLNQEDGFEKLLFVLMQNEYEQRQGNQNRRRLK